MIITQSNRLVLDLPKGIKNRNTSSPNQFSNSSPSIEKVLTFEEIKQFERENILKALKNTNWKIFGADGAAESLGIPPTTLTTRIKRLGLKKSMS